MVFNKLNFIIHDFDRIGLLGVNGTGKTTLLNVISGLSGFDGDRTPFDHPQNYKITYLTQEPDFNPKATILDTVLDDSLPQMRAIKNYEAALLDYENLAKLERAQSGMDALNAWQVEADVKTILTKLQLPDSATLIESLSGGQKRRVQLAQALVNDSDLLLLDEPTNHLDVETIAWLQNYLKNSRRTVLFVTHDRYFLDNVATRIFELEDAGLKEYQGNYQDYLAKKAEDEEREAAASHKAKQLYQSELTWIRKSPQARATKQQARIDRFEDLKDSMKTSKNLGDLELNIASSRLGKKVINFKNAAFSYPDRPIFNDFELIVQGHSRLGIVGDNGVGKSTLLNIIDGELALTDGILEIGETVKIGYFSQEIRGLDENKRMINFLEEVASAAHNSSGENISIVNLLEQFLFPRSSHGTLISKLSGGEKKRLYLLKILLLQPNVLLLDEPTNDLDIATLTVLENFLGSFPGAVLTVSHDRYFINRVATKVLEIAPEGSTEFLGDYDYYVEKKEEVQAESNSSENGEPIESLAQQDFTAQKEAQKNRRKVEREIKACEEKLADLEAKIAALLLEMQENTADFVKLGELQAEIDLFNDEKDEIEMTLLEAMEELENL